MSQPQSIAPAAAASKPTIGSEQMTDAADAVCNAAGQVYAAGQLKRRDGGMQPIAPAGLTQSAAKALRDLAIEQGAVRTIETGLGMGLSALALGEAALRSGDPDALHTAIDPHANWAGYAGLDLVESLPLAAHFRFFAEPSQLVLPRLVDAGERFDLALVDGAHWFDAALMDIYFIMMLLPEGGLVVVDDVWMPSVRMAIEYAITNLGCTVSPTPHPRFAVLARPRKFPPNREWDAFTPFPDPGIERYPQ